MDRVIIGLVLIMTHNSMAQGVSFSWVKSFHGTNQEVGKAVTSDAQGNVYSTGYFLGTVDFDPGVGVYPMSSNGQQDIFISKLDGNGNFVWAKHIGGAGNDMCNAITLDMAGNIYLTGFFRNTVDFNPGAGTAYLNTYASASQDIFICKLDTSGNFLWAKSFGGSGYYDSIGNMYPAVSVAYGIQTDELGYVYCAGSFLGSIDFNPNAGINNLVSLSVPNIFISKLDSGGHFVWARSMGENKAGDEAYAISLDDSGNVYTTGVFGDTADFDPGPASFHLISAAYNQAFVSKLDSSGHFVWAKNMGGQTLNDQASGLSIAIDINGEVVTGGKYKGSGDFDPGNGIINLTSNGNYDMFLTKMNSQGDLIWCESIGGTGSDICSSITTDLCGNVYATGYFKGQVDFDPGTSTSLLTSSVGTSDIFLLKLSPAGDYNWSSRMGGNGSDAGNALLAGPAGSLFITGYYSEIADFDPGTDEVNQIAAGGTDFFLLKLNSNIMVLPITIIRFCGQEVQAGNLLKWDTENELNTDFIEIQKSFDGRNFSIIGVMECMLYNPPSSNYYFVDNRKREGINYYRLKFVDLDNQYQYSNIISVINGEGQPRILVYPNPSQGEVNIFASKYVRKATISITDIKGRSVLLKTNLEGQSFRFDISNETDGMYFIELDELWPESTKCNEYKTHPEMIKLSK